MITLSNINFSYNRVPVIDDVTLHIPRGSWLGLIGPNGVGKTTLLNLISGQLHPQSGKVELDSKPLSKYSRKEMSRLIAVVPQTSPFAFSFTALEIVLMGRYPYLRNFGFETSHDVGIAKDAMKRTDTWQFRDRPIDQLSGGERQRVLIARALTQEPQILLLDEPTTFLDIKHQLDIMEILTQLNKKHGLTIVSAIHDINLAISYCSEIALLDKGRVSNYGTPTEVITYPNLKRTFGAEIYVGVNEITNKPYYVPMKNGAKQNPK